VAVTTSFMPTHPDDGGLYDDATGLIQFSAFMEGPSSKYAEVVGPQPARNYGVAPDFACGHNLHLPDWVQGKREEGFLFVASPTMLNRPGYYLAILQVGRLALLEAFDCWLHPTVSFQQFRAGVLRRNLGLQLHENEPFDYTTWNGNRVTAVIWSVPDFSSGRLGSAFGAEVRGVVYGDRDPEDRQGDAGNVTGRFLNGTVLNSPADAVVEISNPFLGTRITLDMSDPWHPRRTAETGDVEEAGSNHEVWLDFEWSGPNDGDVCHPFSTIADAETAAAPGGAVRIIPGSSRDRPTIGRTKRFRIVAPIGGVIIGARHTSAPAVDDGGGDDVRQDDVWLEFDFSSSSAGRIPGPFNNLPDAAAAVHDGAVIRVVPGITTDRPVIGRGKRFRLVAPLGMVTIGARKP
jgi:hypothetical protein